MEPMEIEPRYFLFHQNMLNFGGNTNRTRDYKAAFESIKKYYDAQVVVAGFTEITNDMSAVPALEELCPTLGTEFCAVVGCTPSALGCREFIGIGVLDRNLVLSLGRILVKASGSSIELIHDISPQPLTNDWLAQVDPRLGASPDYRGLVYVVLQIYQKSRIAVGFIHNNYRDEGNRGVNMQQLPNFLDQMKMDPAIRNAPEGTQIAAYIGGDFNSAAVVANGELRGTSRKGAYLYSAAVEDATYNYAVRQAAQMNNARLLGTTWGGNLFDYWFADISPESQTDVPRAFASGQTLAKGGYGNMSDHAATLLGIG